MSSQQRKSKLFSRRRRNTFSCQSNFKRQRQVDDGADTRVFLLGGNAHDPLNLMSSSDNDKTNTPITSPMVTPRIVNLHDPLNLKGEAEEQNSQDENNQHKQHQQHRHRPKRFKRMRTSSENEINLQNRHNSPREFEISRDAHHQPQRQTLSRDPSPPPPPQQLPEPSPSQPQSQAPAAKLVASTSNADKTEKEHDAGSLDNQHQHDFLPYNPFFERHRKRFNFDKRNSSNNNNNRKNKNERFRYGNYNRYYGYRNGPSSDATSVLKPDTRLAMIPKELLRDKTILDIGCNSGQVTLSIAKDFEPRKVVGIDIDKELIATAKRLLSNFCHDHLMEANHFPKSLPIFFGKLWAIPWSRQIPDKFPSNVIFMHGNYVVESEDDLLNVRPMYDCILCLSITKWIHLNWGDRGLKLMFRRIFLNLRPGGVLVLEPQAFSTYYKKAKLIVSCCCFGCCKH